MRLYRSVRVYFDEDERMYMSYPAPLLSRPVSYLWALKNPQHHCYGLFIISHELKANFNFLARLSFTFEHHSVIYCSDDLNSEYVSTATVHRRDAGMFSNFIGHSIIFTIANSTESVMITAVNFCTTGTINGYYRTPKAAINIISMTAFN